MNNIENNNNYHKNKKPGQKKHVLIIDDEPQIGKIFGLKLKIAGFDVTATTSGADGIEIIRNTRPDIVLLDILMPDVTGFDVLDRVRKFSNVPIVVFTARPETVRIAIGMGANDSITKPADPDRVVNKIREVLAVHLGNDTSTFNPN
jgi:DNA-binding response OmpR family regulator